MNKLTEQNNQIENVNTQIVPENVDSLRAIKEVEGAIIMAKKFPRDETVAYTKIINACKRKGIAEKAMYQYPRGGKVVRGPSIRLAEVLAQSFGNLQYDIRELGRSDEESDVQASCWDLETNFRATKTFKVKHIRDTKNGPKKLKDERDIYEMIANMGSRRGRACILSVIPSDIVQSAIQQCEQTLIDSKEPLSDRIRKMVVAFKEFGVTKEMIENFFNHSIDKVDNKELVDMIGIYNALKDGTAKRFDYFNLGEAIESSDSDLVEKKLKIGEDKNGEIKQKKQK